MNLSTVGTTVTASGTAMGFIAKAIPVLQFISLTVAIVAGILTAVWTGIQILKKRR